MPPIDIKKVEILLFDLGGVIVPWVGIEALENLTSLTRDHIIYQFSSNSVLRKYEIGNCDDDLFAAELNAVFDLGLTIDATKKLWNSWVKPPYPNTETVLQSLRKTYKTACLSNTNSLHWNHLYTLMDMETSFDVKFASQIMNVAKPDAKIYELVIKALDVEPEKILFFDDTLINVEAAADMGLQALHVDRAVGVVPKLKEIGLI